MTPSDSPTGAPTLREALAELVACKDLKDAEKAAREKHYGSGITDDYREAKRLREEYERRQPLAWEAARAALSAQAPPRSNFERECDDADAILRAIGLDPDTYRTDGGSLNVPKIKAAIAHPNDYPRAAQAPPSETVHRALNVFHEYAESQARAGAQAPPAPELIALVQELRQPRITHHEVSRDDEPYETVARTHPVESIKLRAADAIERLAGTPQAAIGAPPQQITSVAQRPEASKGSAPTPAGATAVPQERQVSNLRQSSDSSPEAACVLASAPEAMTANPAGHPAQAVASSNPEAAAEDRAALARALRFQSDPLPDDLEPDHDK